MKVIDSQDWAWFLFEHEGDLYLDAHCNISALSYTYMIRLNAQERSRYENDGRNYLKKLAQDIHYSVPLAKNTQSAYRERDVSNELSKLATDAVSAWRESMQRG